MLTYAPAAYVNSLICLGVWVCVFTELFLGGLRFASEFLQLNLHNCSSHTTNLFFYYLKLQKAAVYLFEFELSINNGSLADESVKEEDVPKYRHL